MYDFEDYKIWINIIVAAIALVAVVLFLVNRRKQTAEKQKERRILSARRRDIEKWDALQERRKDEQRADQDED